MIKPTKLTIFTLLVIFLCSSFGSVSGCVWCEQGLYSEIHVANHADGDKGHAHTQDISSIEVRKEINIEGVPFLLDQHFGESADSCLDFPIDFKSILANETAGADHFSDDIIHSTGLDLKDVNSSFFLNPLNLDVAPRVSQTLLAHRTVVLLT